MIPEILNNMPSREEYGPIMKALIKENKELVPHGIINCFNKLTGEERKKQIKAEQKELFEDESYFMFLLCLQWLSERTIIKRINHKDTSYGLKHDVEDWARRQNIYKPYITNGMFIAACLYVSKFTDLKIKNAVHVNSPNILISISRRF